MDIFHAHCPGRICRGAGRPGGPHFSRMMHNALQTGIFLKLFYTHYNTGHRTIRANQSERHVM